MPKKKKTQTKRAPYATTIIYGSEGAKTFSDKKRRKKISRSEQLAQCLKKTYEDSKDTLIVRHLDGREYAIKK